MRSRTCTYQIFQATAITAAPPCLPHTIVRSSARMTRADSAAPLPPGPPPAGEYASVNEEDFMEMEELQATSGTKRPFDAVDA